MQNPTEYTAREPPPAPDRMWARVAAVSAPIPSTVIWLTCAQWSKSSSRSSRPAVRPK